MMHPNLKENVNHEQIQKSDEQVYEQKSQKSDENKNQVLEG